MPWQFFAFLVMVCWALCYLFAAAGEHLGAVLCGVASLFFNYCVLASLGWAGGGPRASAGGSTSVTHENDEVRRVRNIKVVDETRYFYQTLADKHIRDGRVIEARAGQDGLLPMAPLQFNSSGEVVPMVVDQPPPSREIRAAPVEQPRPADAPRLTAGQRILRGMRGGAEPKALPAPDQKLLPPPGGRVVKW